MASTPNSKTRKPFFSRKKEDPRRTVPSSGLLSSPANNIITITGVTTQAAAPRVPRPNNTNTTNRGSILMPHPPLLPGSIQLQPMDQMNDEQIPKVKPGFLRSFGKKIKRVFRKKPVPAPLSPSSSGSDSGFAGIVASGLPSASMVGIHLRTPPTHHRHTTGVEAAGVGVPTDIGETGGWPMIGGQLLPPVVIPVRSSSLHAYSVNDGYGGEGSGSTIDLIPWNGSTPSSSSSSQGLPLVVAQQHQQHQQSEANTYTLTSTSASASASSSNVAVAGSSTPPIEFLDTNANKPRRTRTRTIARTTTDPPITIKLIHTPSPSDLSSPSVVSEIPSDSDSDLDSCEGLDDLRVVVGAQMNQRWDLLDTGGVDLFADFDSTSPRLEDEDQIGVEEEEEEEEEEDTDEQELHRDDPSTYDGDDDNDHYDRHGPGYGFGSGTSGNHSFHPREDDDRYRDFPPPSSEHRSHFSAPAATRHASPKDSSDESSIPEIPSILQGHPTKNLSREIELNDNQHPRYDESPHHNHDRDPTPTPKRESIAWLDHYLALTSTYRDNLSILQLDLFHSLHHALYGHFQHVLELQHQILGIHGVGNVHKLDNDYLADLVSQKLNRRMERDVKDLQRFCWAQGEVVQQGFWKTMLTVDYEEEDEYEARRVDLKEKSEKEKVKGQSKVKGKLEEEKDEVKEDLVVRKKEEEKELERLVRRVMDRARLPAVEEWPLFRWTALQKPYATLKDLNEARTCMQSLTQHDIVYDTIVHDIVETSVDERKSRESDGEWDSSLAEDSILIRSAEECHRHQQHHSHNQEWWSGDDDNDSSHLKTAAEGPLAPAPRDLDSKCDYAYPSDSHTSGGSETPTPAVRAKTRPFYLQDPSRCRLQSPIEPAAFSRRPLTPTPPPTSEQLDIATPDRSSTEANVSSATNCSGLNSNTEWMRVVRALAATEAVSSAPAGTRLPIWVVYAPPITASPSSSSAVAGATGIPPDAAAAGDDALSKESLSDYNLDYQNELHRQRHYCSSSPTTSSSLFSGDGYIRAGRKRQHNSKHGHDRNEVSATTAKTVVNNHFQGGTHYHYNGSSTTMSNRRPMSVLSRPYSTCSSRSSSSFPAKSSSVSEPSVFIALSSDSCPSRHSTSSYFSSGSQQSLEEKEEIECPTTLSSYPYSLSLQHHQPSLTPLLRESPCSSSRSTIHEEEVVESNSGDENESENENGLLVFSPSPAAPLRNPLYPIPFSKPLPPIPHAVTSSYCHFYAPPPLRPAHYPGHRHPRGFSISIPNPRPSSPPPPSPEASLHYHNPSEPTTAPMTATSRASQVRVRTSGRPPMPPSSPRTRVYELGDPSWRLEDFLVSERASLADTTVTEVSVTEDALNDTSNNIGASTTPSQDQQQQQQQQPFHRVPSRCSVLFLQAAQTDAEMKQKKKQSRKRAVVAAQSSPSSPLFTFNFENCNSSPPAASSLTSSSFSPTYSSCVFFSSSSEGEDINREKWSSATSMAPQQATLASSTTTATTSNPSATATTSPCTAEQGQESPAAAAAEMPDYNSASDSEKKKNRKRASPPYHRRENILHTRQSGHSTSESSDSSDSRMNDDDKLLSSPSVKKKKTFNRRADVREAELVLEGKRVEAACQHASRCHP